MARPPDQFGMPGLSGRTAGPSLAQAKTLVDQGKVREAETVCRQVLKRDRRNPDAFIMLAAIAGMDGRFDQAIAWYEKVVHANPDALAVRCQIGVTRRVQGRHDEAIAAFDAALERDPSFAPALVGKAEVLERRGDFDAARGLLLPMIEAGSEDGHAALVFAILEQRTGRGEQAVPLLRKHAAAPGTGPAGRRQILFRLGEILEACGRYDEAWQAYGDANTVNAPRYVAEAERRRTRRRMEVFSADAMARLPRSTNDSEQPIFIVGMPRCGSTLVDQILASHPSVVSAGETDELPRIVEELPRELRSKLVYPEVVTGIDRATLDRLGHRYLGRLRQLDRSATRIVDKHLLNFAWIGLIEMLFPRARVIDCRRDPVAICFSCYIHDLAPVPHPWAGDLRSLGQYYREYDRLMRHWSDVCDLRMMEVRYEELVDDQEAVTRRILDFAGLAWDPACLRFHETKRAVATFSYEQVRRPMYRGSIERYGPFDAHLEPLRQALAEE